MRTGQRRNTHDARRRETRPGSAPSPVAGVRRRAAFIVVATCLVYANTFAGPFIFDDFGTVVENPVITAGWDWARAFGPSPDTALAGRPLAHLSFAINYAFGALDVAGYHAVNLAIHVIVALLLFGVVRRTIDRYPANSFEPVRAVEVSCAAALLWSVHPLTSEPVNYLTQRTESLMAMCFLLALYANARSHTSRHARNWMAAAIGACLAGAGFKETIAVAPLSVLLYDRVFAFRSIRDALRGRWKFYAGLALTWVVLAVLLARGGQSIAAGFETTNASVWTYFLNQPRMILRYLRLALWPDSLVLYYGWTPAVSLADVWPHLATVSLLFGAAIYTLKKYPAVGFLLAFVFLSLGPTSSVIPIATEVGAERRMYLPMAALAVLAALVLARLATRVAPPAGSARIFLVIVLILSASLSAVTYTRTREYASALTMAQTVLERWPSANAEYLVGTELAAAGDRERAIAHLQAAARAYPPANFPLGVQLMEAGRTAEGIVALETFVKDEPTALASRRAHGLLANTLADQQRFREAIPHYQAFLEAYRNDADAWNALGVAQINDRQLDAAIASFREAVRARPGDEQLSANLVRAEALRRPYK